MTSHLMAPSNDVSVAKKVLIPAAVATAIGIVGLGGFHNPEPSIRQRTIADEHRDRLIAVGYVREVVGHSASGSATALTGAGLRRLESGK